MRLGFDIDGVLARFDTAYDAAIIAYTGVDKFPKDRVYHTVWDYPEEICGYDKKDIDQVWKKIIKKSQDFWYSLPTTEEAVEVLAVVNAMALSGDHDVTFVTSRVGISPKLQTELWLVDKGMALPTVIVSDDKDDALKLLKLDVYIDDKLSHVNRCMGMVRATEMTTRVYLLEAPYNQREVGRMDVTGLLVEDVRDTRDPGVKVVGSVKEMLKEEGLWPQTESMQASS